MQQPPPPPTPRVAQTASPAIAIPGNSGELSAMLATRSEWRAQLESVTERREELADQLSRNPSMGRELQARIQALDDRGSRLEQQILQADEAIAQALVRGVGRQGSQVTVTTAPPAPGLFVPNPGVSDDVLIVLGIGLPVIFAILSVFIYRWGWMRAKRQYAGSSAGGADAERLERLQQAVDVIAVEVERISEGQRYVSKVMNERLQPASLGEGEVERVPVPRASPESARNRG